MISYSFRRRKIVKGSFRNDKLIRKRYDYTLIFSLLSHFNHFLTIIIKWFDSFKYTVIYGSIGNVEGEVRSKIKIKINSRDEKYRDSYLYDSTFLSTGYEKKKEGSKINWDNAPTYKSIHPTDHELKKMHSRFIDKAFFNFKENNNEVDEKNPKEIDLGF